MISYFSLGVNKMKVKITDNKLVYDMIEYINKEIKDPDVRRNVLIVFNTYLTSIENIYNVERERNEKIADRYLKSIIIVFKERLNIFINGDGYPAFKVAYDITNKDKFDRNKITNERLTYLYDKIMFGDFSFEYYYEILLYANKNYDTIDRDLDYLMYAMGYRKPKPDYKDADVKLEKYKGLCAAIKNVE